MAKIALCRPAVRAQHLAACWTQRYYFGEMGKAPKIVAAVGTAKGRGRAKGVGRTGRTTFTPAETSAAVYQHMANADDRHRRAVLNLKALLREFPQELRIKNGRINAARLAEAYAKCPDKDPRRPRFSERYVRDKVIPRYRAELQRFADENLPPVSAG